MSNRSSLSLTSTSAFDRLRRSFIVMKRPQRSVEPLLVPSYLVAALQKTVWRYDAARDDDASVTAAGEALTLSVRLTQQRSPRQVRAAYVAANCADRLMLVDVE